jgi:hypothetical protein
VKFNPRLSSTIDYSFNDVKISSGNFQTHLLGVRFLYTFTPRMYLKAFVQWNSESKAVINNVLFNFIHTPGSDLYIVYNEELDVGGASFKSKNRSVILKFTYLFNF